MIYACNNLSVGKDWKQQRKFLESKLQRNDELIITGNLFQNRSVELKTILEFRKWLREFGVTIYHIFDRQHVLLDDNTASDFVGDFMHGVKVLRHDFPFNVEEDRYMISVEEREHLCDRIKADYYICKHDSSLHRSADGTTLKIPDFHHGDESGGILALTEGSQSFVENDYSPKIMSLHLKSKEDLLFLEENGKREMPNHINVTVEPELINDQKFRVQLKEMLRNGSAKTLKLTEKEELPEQTHSAIELRSEDMFDLEKIKEKILQKIQESDNQDKAVAEKIFNRVFDTYSKNKM